MILLIPGPDGVKAKDQPSAMPARRRWIVATSFGAAMAWALGMLPSTFGDLRWTAATAVLVAAGGLILLTSLPLAQYFVLRDHVTRAARWIPINIAAWLLGITWTLAPSPWIDQSTSRQQAGPRPTRRKR